MTRMFLMAVVAAAAASGCRHAGDRYANLVDPCWPEHYSHTARLEALQPFQAQALNGHTLSHALWNYHFEPGTEKLTPAGLQTLDQMVVARPAIDGRVYLQTTRDIGYDPNAPEKYADMRRDLDTRRAASIQKYLAAQTASRPQAFEVTVIDPADPAISAKYPANALSQLVSQYRASGGGSGSGSTGGGTGGGSGSGGSGSTGGSSR